MLRVEDRSQTPARVLAENPPVRLNENYLGSFPAIKHGPGRVVVAEVHTSRFTNSEMLFFGVSEPFDFSAGDAHEIVTLMHPGANHAPELGPAGPDLARIYYDRAPWGQDGGTYRVRADPGALPPGTMAVVFAQAQVRGAVKLVDDVPVLADGSFSVLLDSKIASSVSTVYVGASKGRLLSDHASQMEDLQVGLVPNVRWVATFGPNADVHEVIRHAAFDLGRRVQHSQQAQRLIAQQRAALTANDGNTVVSEPKAVWFDRSPRDDVLGPGPRSRHAMAWDSARARVVLFGGVNAQRVDTNDTWVLDADGWTKIETEDAPPRRYACAMTYDAFADRIVVFGGLVEGERSADTWVFDNDVWRQIQVQGPSPAPRENARMVYDSQRGQVILFGGLTNTADEVQALGDTWVLQGNTWRKIESPTAPAPRTNFDMAYDEARDQVVLFGGSGLGMPTYSDTWTFDPGAEVWLEHPVNGPAPRSKHAMTYDSELGRVVLSGGIEDFNGAFEPQENAWSWTGQAWRPRPEADVGAVWFHQIQRFSDGLLMFGGDGPGRDPRATDRLWHLYRDGTSQAVIYSDQVPAARERAAMVFDETQSKLLVYGGFDGEAWLHDTWSWDHSGWKLRPSVQRPRLSDPQLVATSSGSWLVGAGESSTEVWSYASGDWQALTSSVSDLEPRSEFSVASQEQGFVAFGGYNDTQTLSDTWGFDGAQWSQIDITGPGARYGHATVNVQGQVQLYGGRTRAGPLSDSWWYLSAEGWARQSQSGASPSGRAFFGLTHDPGRGQVLLYGGQQASGEASGEIWQWSGEFEPWAALKTQAQSPGTLMRQAQTYDSHRRSIFVFGGCRTACISGGRTQKTWELHRDPNQSAAIEFAVKVDPSLLQAEVQSLSLRTVASAGAQVFLWQAQDGRWLNIGEVVGGAFNVSLDRDVVRAALGATEHLYFVLKAAPLQGLRGGYVEVEILGRVI